jgi:putative membrane protein
MAHRVEYLFLGAVAGLIATVPMTAFMVAGKRRMSLWSQDPLPPAQITHQALRTVDLDDDVSRSQEAALTAVNHFAYGAGMGAVYAQLVHPQTARGAIATGVAYGLGVWTLSYCGWLPVAGLYRSATEDTAERNALMIGAHVAWGGSLGLACHLLRRREARTNAPPRNRLRRTENESPLLARHK